MDEEEGVTEYETSGRIERSGGAVQRERANIPDNTHVQRPPMDCGQLAHIHADRSSFAVNSQRANASSSSDVRLPRITWDRPA